MQITESGVTTVTNVENSDNSVLCQNLENVPDSNDQLNAHMADTANSDSGADTASEVATSDENIEVIKSQFSKSCTENLEVDIDNVKTNRNVIEGTSTDVVNGSGAELGILEQADTTSVENLSIVTVVEKELEAASELIQNSKYQEYTNASGKSTVL